MPDPVWGTAAPLCRDHSRTARSATSSTEPESAVHILEPAGAAETIWAHLWHFTTENCDLHMGKGHLPQTPQGS